MGRFESEWTKPRHPRQGLTSSKLACSSPQAFAASQFRLAPMLAPSLTSSAAAISTLRRDSPSSSLAVSSSRAASCRNALLSAACVNMMARLRAESVGAHA